MTFEGRGSGSWYCGFRFGAEERDVPIGEPFILHKFRLIAGESGKHNGFSISQSLAALTAFLVLSLLSFKAALNWLLNDFFVRPMRENR